MLAFTVLMDWAHEPDGGRCPYGLVLVVEHGSGISAHRCQGKAQHKGPHSYATSYPSDVA
jgi:hypothetical protein